MDEKVYKCTVCGGIEYPCVLTIKSSGNIADPPTNCPLSLYKPKWEEVKE